NIPVKCFMLYGMSGSRQRLAVVRCLQNRKNAAPESSNDNEEDVGESGMETNG
ncbi:hypothetical protein Dimus_001349, partial [Dionaea muscipula]